MDVAKPQSVGPTNCLPRVILSPLGRLQPRTAISPPLITALEASDVVVGRHHL
jgi:hypothetical protein